jgi:hypothetical protein
MSNTHIAMDLDQDTTLTASLHESTATLVLDATSNPSDSLPLKIADSNGTQIRNVRSMARLLASRPNNSTDCLDKRLARSRARNCH